jgi:MYXO-CTERM domain-containing protein
MKKILLAGLIAAGASFSAHALNAGDLMFTSINADEDGWAMVATTNIAAGTVVYFTDNEWNGVSAFNTGESFHKWTTGAISAGTVIRFSAIDNATTLASTSGTFARETVSGSSNYGLSQSEDTVYAYQGSSATAPTSFLAAISTSTYGTAAGGSLAATGLTVGASAVQVGFGSDFAQYNGARSGQENFAAYKPLVANVANWQDLGDGSFATTVPDATAFTVSPVPEADMWAMLLAGLGLIGFIGRRRSK